MTRKKVGLARRGVFRGRVVVSWTEQPIFFVDFEGSRASGILEFGVAEVRGGRIVSTRTRLCRPAGPVREEDAAVHGLREPALRDHAPFSDEWEYFLGLRERGPLAAHYSGAENGLLKSVWPYPRAVPDFARPGASIVDWGPWVDSARLCAELVPASGSGRLEAVVAAAGMQAELDALASEHCPADRRRYHAALYDALAGALLLVFLSRDPRVAGLSMMQVLALSTLDPARRDALQQGELF